MFVSIEQAIELLKKGEIVILPTETVYGLGGIATKEMAIEKIYEIKKRPKNNPLICHIGNLNTIYKFSFINKEEEKLLELFPGPLTLLLRKKNIPDIVTAGSEYCAFRMPNHPIFLEISQKIEEPIAAPSANPFGKISPTTEKMAFEYFGNQIPIVDGGKCQVGIESTVIRLLDHNTIEILRPGFFTKEFFIKKGYKVIEKLPSKEKNQKLLSPGLLAKHYAPNIPLVLFNQNYFKLLEKNNYKESLIQILESSYTNLKKENLKNKKIGFLIYGKIEISNEFIYNLSENSDLEEIAKNLFSFLKEMEKKFDYIFTFKTPDKGIGIAINDRLKRAAEFIVE